MIVSFLAESVLREDRDQLSDLAIGGGGRRPAALAGRRRSRLAMAWAGGGLLSPALAALDWRWHGPTAGCSRRPSPLSTGDGMGLRRAALAGRRRSRLAMAWAGGGLLSPAVAALDWRGRGRQADGGLLKSLC